MKSTIEPTIAKVKTFDCKIAAVAAVVVLVGVGAFSFMGNATPQCDDGDVMDAVRNEVKREYESIFTKRQVIKSRNYDVLDVIESGNYDDPKYKEFFEKVDDMLDSIELDNFRAEKVEDEIKRVTCKVDMEFVEEGIRKKEVIPYFAQRLNNGKLFVGLWE